MVLVKNSTVFLQAGFWKKSYITQGGKLSCYLQLMVSQSCDKNFLEDLEAESIILG